MVDILLYILIGCFVLFGIIILLGGLGSREYAGWLRYPAGIFMIVGTVWWAFIQLPKFEEDQIQKYEGMNLIEFFDHRQEHPGDAGIPDGIGFTTTSLNLRKGPSLKDEVMLTLSAGDKVNLTLRREKDWFQVTYNGEIGWINGNYVRPIRFDERDEYIDNSVGKGFKLAIKGAFPEKTIKGKIIGYFVGLVFSTILSYLLFKFFGQNKWIDALVGAVPVAFFFVKNLASSDFSILERNTIMISYIIVSIAISMPIEWLNFKILKPFSRGRR